MQRRSYLRALLTKRPFAAELRAYDAAGLPDFRRS